MAQNSQNNEMWAEHEPRAISDQQSLVCNYPQDSLPCDQAEVFYNLVEFGKIEDN